MTNTLAKSVLTDYTPGSPGVPASPGQPYRAAYTSLERQLVCGYVSTGGTWQWMPITKPDGTISYEYVLVPSGGGPATYSYQCSYQDVPVYHPEQPYIAPTPGTPGTEERLVRDFNLGWNAGARSISSFPNDGAVTFKLMPGSQGIAIGLDTSDAHTDPALLPHGLRLIGSGLTGYYPGRPAIEVVETGHDPEGAVLWGQVVPNFADVWRIERRLGVVRYYQNDTLRYTSERPSTGTVFLHAVMYWGGDAVDAPTLLAYQSADLSLQPLAVAAGAGVGTNASGSASLHPLTMAAGVFYGASLALPALAAMGSDYPVGFANLSLRPLTLGGSAGAPAYNFALATLSLSQMTMAAHGLTGGVGQVSVSLPKLTMLAGRSGYAAGSMALAPMTMYASAYEGNLQASMNELAVASTTVLLQAVVGVQLVSEVGAQDSMAALVLHDAAAISTVTATPTMSVSAVLQALMETEVQVFAGVPVMTEAGEVWVVNDESGASALYENYDFNSYARYQGKYLGAKSDGVYLLEGGTDASAPIRSSISLGQHDFGTTLAKTATSCLIGLSSSGNVYLRVVANGQTHTYKSARKSSYLDIQRIVPGKGIKANYLTFELYNEAGADFELASVEFQAAVLSRRI